MAWTENTVQVSQNCNQVQYYTIQPPSYCQMKQTDWIKPVHTRLHVLCTLCTVCTMCTMHTFLSSGVSWLSSMLMFSEFHSQSWLLKYSSRPMALCRRLKMRIILKREVKGYILYTRHGTVAPRFGFKAWRIAASLTAAFVQRDGGRGRRWGRGTCGWPGSSTGWSGSWRWCWRWASGKPAPAGSSWRTTSHGALQNEGMFSGIHQTVKCSIYLRLEGR